MVGGCEVVSCFENRRELRHHFVFEMTALVRNPIFGAPKVVIQSFKASTALSVPHVRVLLALRIAEVLRKYKDVLPVLLAF